MMWMLKEAEKAGLQFESYLSQVSLNPLATQHKSYRKYYRLLSKKTRRIPNPKTNPTYVHKSVAQRYEGVSNENLPLPLKNYIDKYKQWPPITE